jgi:hypothetical protein
VRICVCTLGSAAHQLRKRERFWTLARQDAVGVHEPEPDPERADALLFVDTHNHYEKSLLPPVRRHPLVRQFLHKAFVYDERDVPIFTLPGVYVSARSRGWHRHAILGGPYDHVLNCLSPATEPPDLLFSFQGADCHRIRGVVLELSHPRGIVRDNGGVDFFRPREAGPERLAQAREEYAALIHRSKFVLCPRGRGPTSFRLYETMMAGRVPVVISDSWLPAPGIDWSRAVVRIAERDAPRIPALLEALEPRWPELVAGMQAEFFAHLAPDRLWHHFASSIAELARARRRWGVPWWMQEEVARVGPRRVRQVIRARRAA